MEVTNTNELKPLPEGKTTAEELKSQGWVLKQKSAKGLIFNRTTPKGVQIAKLSPQGYADLL